MKKLLFALAALSATAPLAASERDIPHTVRITYADLDLTGDAGKTTLDHRIERALRDLCGEDQQLGLAKRLQEIRCRRSAMTQIAVQRDRVLANAQNRLAPRATAAVQSSAGPTSGAD